LKILKEWAINLTSYEKKSLYRFLSLYLISVLILLGIIGYLFYQNSANITSSKVKFEMLYTVRNLEEKIIKAIKERKIKSAKETLQYIKPLPFKIGIFDKNSKPIYSEIGNSFTNKERFYIHNNQYYSVIKYPPNNLNIGYIVLRDDNLSSYLKKLKLKIIYYTIALFIFMALMGIFLSKLFLRPVKDKIKDIDRFIEDTTHELNTPISAILMTVESLKGIEEKKLKRLKASALRLSTMYERLTCSLKYSGNCTDVETFNLNKLLHKRVEVFEIIASAKNINFKIKSNTCYIKASKEDIKRVIDNLLSNAIKYSNKNNTVYIKLSNCKLFICDRGIGIKKEQLNDIFQRYKRLSDKEGGFGIGLNIVMEVCKKYNLKIDIKSKYKIGTCFIVDFARIIHI